MDRPLRIPSRRPDRKMLEGVACMTVWSLSAWLVFQTDHFAYYFHPYLLVALLAWPAMRLGQRGVTLAILVLFVIAWSVNRLPTDRLLGTGESLTSAERLLEQQVFLGFMAVVGYLLAAGYTGLVQAEKGSAIDAIQHGSTRSDALFWITPDGRIVDVNAAACRSLGYTREELLRLAAPEVDARYELGGRRQHFAELRQRGSLTFDSEHRAEDGRLIPVEVVANYVQFGAEEWNSLRCATSRNEKAEEELRWKTAFLEAQVNSSPDGILVVDGSKEVLSNQRLVELWGLPQHILDDPDDAALLQYVDEH